MGEQENQGRAPTPGSGDLPPKIQLNLGKVANGGRKPDTSRIDLSAAEAPAPVAPSGEPLSVREVLDQGGPQTSVRLPTPEQAKSQTTRISLHDSQPMKPGEQVPVAKAATSRIPLTESQQVSTSAGEVPKAIPIKRATSRIEVLPEGPPAAQPDAAAVAQQGSLGRTARIIVEEGEGELPPGGSLGDTGKMEVPSEVLPKPPPKTVRLQRPAGAAPKTIVLKKPEGVGPAPKTVVLKRPAESAAAQPMISPPSQAPHTVEVGAPGGTLEEKGTTARISIPPSGVDTTAAPPTQRKTIRIKRAEGTPVSSARTVVLARPGLKLAPQPTVEEVPAGGEAAAAELAEALGVPTTAEPGVGYAIVGILTVLVLGAVLYALLAQTYFPDWPMPGRAV